MDVPSISDASVIAQIGDTAGVPQRLSAGLRHRGFHVVESTPPAPLADSPAWLKAVSIPQRFRWARATIGQLRDRRADVLHVHYATAAISMLRSGIPLVVHAHGTDVRSPAGLQRAMLSPVWREAGLRLVSTPDLLDAVPDSVYLPNPIDVERFRAAQLVLPDTDVLVFAALTAVKGAPALVEAVRLIKLARPDVTINAIAGGAYENEMRLAGAEIIPREAALRLPGVIARHRVVLGQQVLGALGVADLEAMATGRPVVMHLRSDLDYGEPPPISNARGPEAVASTTLSLLDDSVAMSRLGEESWRWTDRHHRIDSVVEQLLGLYEAGLGIRLRPGG